MKNKIAITSLAVVTSLAAASACLAGTAPPVGAPSPLLGAGLPGLAIMAVAGGGYVLMRLRRRGRD